MVYEYQNPRVGDDKQNSDIIGDPSEFTHDVFENNMRELLHAKGYMPHDFFDQNTIDQNATTVFFNFVMQYSPEATLDLLKRLNNVSDGSPIPICLNVRMDSESFYIQDDWVQDVFGKIKWLANLDVSYAIMISPSYDPKRALMDAATSLKNVTGIPPKGFHLVTRAGNQAQNLPDTIQGMKNVTSPELKRYGDMWSDSNGGWFGSLTSKLNTVNGKRSLLIQNSEGAWWSPKPMHAWDRLKRIGDTLKGSFPAQYVAEVKDGKRFIPGEDRSIITLEKPPSPPTQKRSPS